MLALLLGELLALRADPGKARGARGSRRRGHGLLGGSFAAAALAVWAQRAGLPAGWGVQLQEPAVAAVLLVAALPPDAQPLESGGNPPGPGPGGRRRSRPGTARHLLAGLFTVPLALAWTLPLLDEPVGFAAGKGSAVILTVFAALGVGLAPSIPVPRPRPGGGPRAPRCPGGGRACSGRGWVPRRGERALAALLPLPPGDSRGARLDRAAPCSPWPSRLAAPPGPHKNALRFSLAAGAGGMRRRGPWLADDNRLAPRSGTAAEPQITKRLTGD